MKNRREFLKQSSGLFGLSALHLINPPKALLSFSTLGCPSWNFSQVIQQAVENKYSGIEIRGIKGDLDLPANSIFSPTNISSTRRQVEDAGLKIVNLGSSSNMHFLDPKKRQSNLDEAKKYIELANHLSCPFIRVFPNDLPKDQPEKETVNAIIQSLIELGDFAKTSGVKVLLESHGKVIKSDMLLHIMQETNHAHVGLVWDFFNMWSITKEPPAIVYSLLKKYILHTHIKDAIVSDVGEKYTLLGEGHAPIREALHALKLGGYAGYYSFEWEKLWHPEIQEPEIAIPHFSKNFSTYWQ
ncbi:sugar phosphate isomerase/epimerase [Cytophagaceae bacterium 50C-KIRBA]|uniref:Sugar phosphate isomerase/epimerase n=1 Tax=Aquirufa beregesia TaxID=2516556 RepID=A0ABX0ET13_9BACT|nr:sugar phosphate isomerase/epimerase family protein [Aquirufa beregesia]NGZ43601.1 sugar phosphate isomerase/epimerase [Aquirufa beregesia]